MPKRPELAADVAELPGGPHAPPVVVAVSGGADSVAMLLLLCDASREKKLPSLHVAHLNHHLREGDAERDARFVRDLAASLGLPFTLGDVDVRATARERRLSTEHAARECRYAFLDETAGAVGARFVALGHTADDQVETVLLHLMRGAGVHGLAGMPRCRPIAPGSAVSIVRPVLDCARSDLVRFLDEAGRDYCIDHTNVDVTYTRNRVRHELIPALESSWPTLREDVRDFARTLGELDALLANRAESWLANHASAEGGVVEIALDAMQSLEEPLASYVVRGAMACVLGDLRRIDEVHVRMVLDLVTAGSTGASLDLPRALIVSREHNRIAFREKKGTGAFNFAEETAVGAIGAGNTRETTAPVPFICDVALPVLGEARWGGWTLRTEVLEGDAIWRELEVLCGCQRIREFDDPPADARERMLVFMRQLRQIDPEAAEYVDFDRVGGRSLTVRRRRPGDRLTPLGAPGSRKLKDYLISRHVPRAERDLVPIISADDKILVIAGLGVDNDVALTEHTRRVLRITTTRTHHEEETG